MSIPIKENVYKLYKESGQTPLQCINILKNSEPQLKLSPATYAGRLDPLAEGVLLILIGPECLNKDKYLALDKEYEVDVLFGFSTDTYDIMGTITDNMDIVPRKEEIYKSLNKIINDFIGTITQKYPPYSSRPVLGKPLFMWAREDKLSNIQIPEHKVEIKDINITGDYFIKGDELLLNVKERISKVHGDFRQEEIIKDWAKTLCNKNDQKYFVVKLKISCGSGVYVRGIADEIGKKLNIPALAYKIVRTRIGTFTIN